MGIDMVAEVAIESDGKFASAITILSPWPALAKACSKSAGMLFGIPISGIRNKCVYSSWYGTPKDAISDARAIHKSQLELNKGGSQQLQNIQNFKNYYSVKYTPRKPGTPNSNSGIRGRDRKEKQNSAEFSYSVCHTIR